MNETIFSELLTLKARGKLREALDIVLDLEKTLEEQQIGFWIRLQLLKSEMCMELGWLEESKKILETVVKTISSNPSLTVDFEVAKLHTDLRVTEISRLKGHNHTLELAYVELLHRLKEKDLGLSKKMEMKLLSMILEEQGEYKTREGHLKDALDLFSQTTSTISEMEETEADDIARMMHAHNRIADIHVRLGNSDEGLHHVQQALQLLDNELTMTDHVNELAHAYHSIGMAFARQGNLQKALQFSKDSLKLAEKTDPTVHHAAILFTAFLLSLRDEDETTANTALSQLESLAIQSEMEETRQYHQLAQAIILKKRKRLEPISQSRTILKTLLARPTVNHEIKAAALMNLIGITIGELIMTNNTEVFEDLDNYIQELKTIADITSSDDLLTRTMIIQAKIAMFEKDVVKSKRMLQRAHELAVERENTRLEQSIFHNQDVLLTVSNSPWVTNDQKQGHEFLKEVLDLEESFTYAPFIASTVTKFAEEEPIWLIIVKKGGISVYSQTFDPNVHVNEQFIAGLITAIDILGRESLPHSGSVERIIYDNYNIVIKRSNGLLFCYAYSKHSYPALKKLDQFINVLKEKSDLWNVLDRDIPFLTEAESITLNRLAQAIFHISP